MARRLIVDTCVLVMSERSRGTLTDAIEADDDLAISAITVAELRTGIKLATEARREGRSELLLRVLETLSVVNRPGVSGDSVCWESGVMGRAAKNYPRELQERAVLMVKDVRADYGSEWAAMEAVATKLGIGSTETLRKWARRMEVDSGVRPGVTSSESADLRKLRAENRELRRANEIVKAASVFFAAELDRPQR